MLGDVDSPEALERYQAAKRAYKASLRAHEAVSALMIGTPKGGSACRQYSMLDEVLDDDRPGDRRQVPAGDPRLTFASSSATG